VAPVVQNIFKKNEYFRKIAETNLQQRSENAHNAEL
jgi:hypothetical protein